jgi:DNA-binding LytR/AlgR family response regulator
MRRLPEVRNTHQPDAHQVLYLIGNINYCFLHLVTGEVVLSCRTLKWFATRWTHFIRVHKKALVNLSYVTFSKISENGYQVNYVIMADQTQLAISRRRASDVFQILSQQTQSVVQS